MSTENKSETEIAIYEEIRKNTQIASKEELNIPLSMVFGHGTLGNIESFGDKSLLENTMKVDAALNNVSELNNIWNHSHSQWTWRHLNLNYHSPFKNMRQIAAEISGLKSSLNSAKWNYVRREAEIKKLEEKLSNPDIEYWEEVETKIALAELKESLAGEMLVIEGAMKDVLSLNELYEQLKSKVNSFSEEDFEKEEAKNHLQRSLVQCIRDVRQYGSITKGEQEYLENIGVNPSKTEKILREYVEHEREKSSWTIIELYEFVEELADELIHKHNIEKVRMELSGFTGETNPKLSYTKTVAIPKSE